MENTATEVKKTKLTDFPRDAFVVKEPKNRAKGRIFVSFTYKPLNLTIIRSGFSRPSIYRELERAMETELRDLGVLESKEESKTEGLQIT